LTVTDNGCQASRRGVLTARAHIGMNMQVEVRRIRHDEGLRLRGLRLQALADAPMAFGSTLAGEAAFADDVWRARASGSALGSERVTAVAERGGDWIGMATGLVTDPDGERGPVLVGMFVVPEARSAHVGLSLVAQRGAVA
jgi:hypothetical protein